MLGKKKKRNFLYFTFDGEVTPDNSCKSRLAPESLDAAGLPVTLSLSILELSSTYLSWKKKEKK